MLQILDGKNLSKKIKNKLIQTVNNLNRKPKLVIISIGNDFASKVYVKNKIKACEEVGIDITVISKEIDITREQLIQIIDMLNQDPQIDGIIVQEPLPKHLEGVSEQISIDKDVDGFTSGNLGKLILNDNTAYIPCTPKGIVQLLNTTDIPIEGKNVVIIGRSKIVGKPLAILLTNMNATVTLCHSKTTNLKQICQTCDILITAVGKPNFITRDYIGNNTRIVIDVGINRTQNGKVVGDVNYEEVCQIFKNRINTNYITPVPRGVGPMTVTNLISNTIISYIKRNSDTNIIGG